jgi:hypothetical protein
MFWLEQLVMFWSDPLGPVIFTLISWRDRSSGTRRRFVLNWALTVAYCLWVGSTW